MLDVMCSELRVHSFSILQYLQWQCGDSGQQVGVRVQGTPPSAPRARCCAKGKAPSRPRFPGAARALIIP